MIAFARPFAVALDTPHHAAASALSPADGSPPTESSAHAVPHSDWQRGFLALLPDIYSQVCYGFRRLSGERRDEAVQEALANAMVAYRRLAELGKTKLAYASPLAQYAVRQVRSGRKVASSLNVYEMLSVYAQRKLGFAVDRLSCPDATEGTWKELLVADRRATPAELAASRLDFAAWWRLLPRRKRRIAAALAEGATTSEAAHAFKLTAGRISQLRRELQLSWQTFQGESPAGAAER
jgi:hypothetical protein